MKIALWIASATTILLGIAQGAQAEPANTKTVGELRSFCKGFGTFYPPTSMNHGLYGCLMDVDQGGGLLICEPAGDLKQTVCSTFAKAPPHRRGFLPTEKALKVAAKADPSILSPDPHGPLMRRLASWHAMRPRP